jgi:hypothetical protein
MGKRSSFKRKERDFYPTPYQAVLPLLPHIPYATKFCEPCYGEGHLARHLELHGHEMVAWAEIKNGGLDAMDIASTSADMFITNPPWPMPGKKGDPTIKMALHLSSIAPTWFLLNADVMHNRYFSSISKRCVKIVSVGRVSWEGNGISGKENCAWFLFNESFKGRTEFYEKVS